MKYEIGQRVKWHCFKYRVIGYKIKNSSIVTVMGESGLFCTLHEREIKPIITMKAVIGDEV